MEDEEEFVVEVPMEIRQQIARRILAQMEAEEND